MTTLEVLKGARELITPVSNWCYGVSAKSASGRGVSSRSRTAVCWDARAAICKIAYQLDAQVFRNEAARLVRASFGVEINRQRSLSWLNDTYGHEQVLAAFDRAIASLEAA